MGTGEDAIGQMTNDIEMMPVMSDSEAAPAVSAHARCSTVTGPICWWVGKACDTVAHVGLGCTGGVNVRTMPAGQPAGRPGCMPDLPCAPPPLN